MRKRTKKEKVFWIMALGISATAMLCAAGVKKVITNDEKKEPVAVAENSEDAEWDWQNGDNHADETIYAGETYVPEILYVPAFKDSESTYTSNKELYEELGTDGLDAVSGIVEDFWRGVLGMKYRDENIADTVKALKGSIAQGCVLGETDSEYESSGEDIISMLTDMAISNHVSMNGDYISDSSLIYSNSIKTGSYTVRSIIRFTVVEADDTKLLQDIFGLDEIELGKEYSFIIETDIVQGSIAGDITDSKIGGFSIIAKVEG